MKKVKGIYLFKITDGPDGKEGVWTVDVKNGNGAVAYGSNGKMLEHIISSNDEDKLINRKKL